MGDTPRRLAVDHSVEEALAPEEGTTPTLGRMAGAFFKIGLTAYGMAILQELKALMIGSGWLAREEVDEGLGMVQVYPGPIVYNLATYCAYRIRGIRGAVVATTMFLIPSYLLMLGLSWLYFTYGDVGWVRPLFIALEAMVVGVVLHVLLDFGSRYLDGARTATIAGVAFLFLLNGANAIAVVFGAIAAGILLFHGQPTDPAGGSVDGWRIPGDGRTRGRAIALIGGVFVAVATASLISDTVSAAVLGSMFRIGAVAFGNGMTIMPLLQQAAVDTHHWVTPGDFATGIALGQITPGPFLITATFIGFAATGVWGSLLATIGIFFPSFFYTLLMTEFYGRIRSVPAIRHGLKGVLAGFTGMLALVVLNLGRVSLVSSAAYVWAVGAFVLVRWFELNLLWIFGLGAAAAGILYALGFHIV